MMGHQGGVQDKLFYSFNLDDHVPQSHLLRGIDRVFDLSDLRHHLAPGRPRLMSTSAATSAGWGVGPMPLTFALNRGPRRRGSHTKVSVAYFG